MERVFILLIIVSIYVSIILFYEEKYIFAVGCLIVLLVSVLGLFCKIEEDAYDKEINTIYTYEVSNIIYDKEEDEYVVEYDRDGTILCVSVDGDDVIYDSSTTKIQIKMLIDKHSEYCPVRLLLKDRVSYKLIFPINCKGE